MSTRSLLRNNHKAALNGKDCMPLLLLCLRAKHNSNNGTRRAEDRSWQAEAATNVAL